MSHDPIFFTVPSGNTKCSRVLHKGGGGGGGDGGAAQREQERQDRIRAGTDQVNQIFGMGNSEAQQQRQAMYDTTKNDTRSFYTNQLEEDRAAARRQLDFQKARQGIIGSSQANDLDSEFQKRYDRGLLDVANRSENAATQFRTSDEQARLGLVSKVVAGLDQGTAAQNAMSSLQTNQNAAKEAYQSQRMANVFADLLGTYQQGQFNQGMQAGKQQGTNQYGNYTPAAEGISGDVSKNY
jgi:hypothetical protein